MTTAETVAAKLDDDGSRFWTGSRAGDGAHLDELAKNRAGRREQREERSSDEYRWIFPDGSVVTVCGAAWDLGYADCWCWDGSGHDEGCEASLARSGAPNQEA
jgi:hypothetical protein